MRYIFFIASFLLFQVCCIAGDKGCLRALIVADTITASTASSCENDVEVMKKALQIICKKIRYQLQLNVLRGTDFTRHKIKKWFLSVPDCDDDIVFFFFAGHGAKDGIQGPWPIFDIPDGKYLRSAAILDFLRHHRQRLSVVVVNCCNSEPSVIDSHEILTQSCQVLSSHKKLPGLKSLFLGTKGIVFISASSPGGCAYVVPRRGTVLMAHFIQTLNSLCHQTTATWKDILLETQNRCFRATQGFREGPQNPIFLIE